MKKITALGIMSGSSLDGLDLSLVEFSLDSRDWNYTMIKNDSVNFDEDWRTELKKVRDISSERLFELDIQFGKWIGEKVITFLKETGQKPDIISSHGHTAFHNPTRGYSVQIGNAQAIACTSGIPVVSNFRSLDILKGGQGAPLVPAGEQALFGEYSIFLNLGGIANISVLLPEKQSAWDVVPCNQVLNSFAEKLGAPFDKGGEWARSGKVQEEWLADLLSITYFDREPPKSISNEWVEQVFLNSLPSEAHGGIATYTKFVAMRIERDLERFVPPSVNGNVLVTGGGAYNACLLSYLRESKRFQYVVPDQKLVEFKESLIFAYLGACRWLGRVNVLSSTTGAISDSAAGTIYLP